VIAAGGIYDKLVNAFLPLNVSSICNAVGVSIAVEKLAAYVVHHQQSVQEQQQQQQQQQISKVNKAILATTEADVLVCSVGRNTLEDRLIIASELWKANIKSELNHNENLSLEQLYSYCKGCGIGWVVVVKADTDIVRVKNVERKTEEQVPRESLVNHLTSIIRHRTKQQQQSLLSLAENHFSSELPPIEVFLLGPDIQGTRWKHRIISQALAKIGPTLRKWHTRQTAQVAAIDLPCTVLKEFLYSYDATTESTSCSEKYPRYKEKIFQLIAFLSKRKTNFPFVFLYSFSEDNFEVMIFR